MIQVDGLTKRYRDHVAVSNISFEVGRGEIVGFLALQPRKPTCTKRQSSKAELIGKLHQDYSQWICCCGHLVQEEYIPIFEYHVLTNHS